MTASNMGNFHITRVISRDIVRDAFNGIRNLFGLRMRNWEDSLNRNMGEMKKEMNLKYKVSWYRMIVNPLTNGSAMIILYGDGAKK